MTLEVLIQEIKSGNKSAEQCLYNKLNARYLVLCRRYVGNREDAEERMLDGFYKFFTSIQSFTYCHDEGLYSWIKRIMVNECLKQLRSKSHLNLAYDDEIDDVAEREVIIGQLSVAEIIKCITQLPYGYRTVLNLFAVEGMEHSEIASLLGISKNSSKSQLSRGRQLLQKILTANSIAYVK